MEQLTIGQVAVALAFVAALIASVKSIGATIKKAIEENRFLRAGMTCWGGKLTLRETALKQGRQWTDAEELTKTW